MNDIWFFSICVMLNTVAVLVNIVNVTKMREEFCERFVKDEISLFNANRTLEEHTFEIEKLKGEYETD